ncbi:MAG: cupin domain-containing protein [Marmoricola sp.]
MTDRSAELTGELDASLDALSDVLDLIHLRGEALTRYLGGPAEVRHQNGERMVHLVKEGPVKVTIAGQTHELQQGDTALLAGGAAHRVSTANGAWMSGRFVADETAAGPMLSVLPPLIVIRAAQGELRWIPLAGELLAMEITDPSAGSRVMVSRLLDLVFIQALRAWSASDAAGGDPGWLTAALDRTLGPALRAIHRHPERPWTVEELAELSALSRAAFAARFTQKVGDPPARYLTRIRLARAADELATTTQPISAVGRGVGYESEAAFSRAFSREYGVAPRAWRTSHNI